MAISHVQPLLILLASLFFLPDLRAVKFEYCDGNVFTFGKITRVEVSPAPIKTKEDGTVITITVYGSADKASKYIKSGFVDVFLKESDFNYQQRSYDLCQVNDACHIKPGTDFVLTLSNVPYTASFAVDYEKYEVTLSDQIGEPGSEDPTEVMCVAFSIPTYTTPTFVSA